MCLGYVLRACSQVTSVLALYLCRHVHRVYNLLINIFLSCVLV